MPSLPGNKYSFIRISPFSKYIFRSAPGSPDLPLPPNSLRSLMPDPVPLLHTGIIGVFFYSRAGDQTQGFVPMKQELYQLKYTPSSKFNFYKENHDSLKDLGTLGSCLAVTTWSRRKAFPLKIPGATLPID